MKYLELKLPPPVIAVICCVVMWRLSLFSPAVEIDQTIKIVAITIFSIAGFLSGFLGVICFKRNRTILNPHRPLETSSLVTGGIYRVTRNPMYIGIVFILVAWAIYLSSLWSLLGIVGFIAYIQQFQIKPEERALLELFGSEYQTYQSKIRRWL